MRINLPSRRSWLGANAILLYVALGKLLLHLLTSNYYGYFIDELYTIACGRHLAFGYADIPPLVPALSRLSGLLLGYSMPAIRLLPALAGAATVILVGLTARRLGGGRFTQALAATAVALGPVWLSSNSFMAYDGFNLLMTALFFYLLTGLLAQDRPPLRQWLLFGAAAGFGLLTKLSLLTYGFALAAALLLTPQRRYFTRRGIWLAGLLAVALLSPYLIWQHLHGWPVLEYLGNYKGQVNPMSPLEFLVMQILSMNPLALPLWAAGLVFYFSTPGRRYRAFGWIFLLLLLLFTMVVKVKFYFMSPAFMPLFAAGAVWLEHATRAAARRWLRPAYAVLLALGWVMGAPLSMPLLPPAALVQYVKGATGFGFGAVKVGSQVTAELPQFFADRFGWDDLVRAVARVYGELSPAERAECTIFGGSYGEAGAVDLLGEEYGLPKAVSGHLAYFYWGPGEHSGRIVIAAGVSRADLESNFGRVEEKAVAVNKYALPWRQRSPVYLCREPKYASLREIWPQTKKIE